MKVTVPAVFPPAVLRSHVTGLSSLTVIVSGQSAWPFGAPCVSSSCSIDFSLDRRGVDRAGGARRVVAATAREREHPGRHHTGDRRLVHARAPRGSCSHLRLLR